MGLFSLGRVGAIPMNEISYLVPQTEGICVGVSPRPNSQFSTPHPPVCLQDTDLTDDLQAQIDTLTAMLNQLVSILITTCDSITVISVHSLTHTCI